ncbi:IS481 family transposase [Candidatus Palauibacter sp.]|uniref:IS481 family transposase n=1 Tax=Candidatus Palauibacter sp. TaxID=3101350 RepID=UPI003D0B6BC6
MNVHKNAKLTPAGRAVLVRRIEDGEPVGVVAREMGVSRRTVYKWLKRFREEGEAGLRDRSSRPHRHPHRIPRQQRRRIERLRRERWSGPRIADHLKMPISTVTLEVRRLGLNRLESLAPPEPVVRYERSRPGSLVHMDTKKLARIERPGHRIDGDRSKTVKGAGWEYYHAAVDDASRVAYGEVLPGERKEDAVAFLLRVVAFFERQGVKISQLMTDNGGCYRSKRFRRTLRELGIGHIFTRPYTPRTNGKVERFIRTSLTEWAYGRSYPHSRVRTRVLRVWLRYYNLRRRHTAIGRLTPMQRLVELRVTNVLGIYT